MQNDDLVGIANGRQTMRDDQDGSIGFEPSQGRLDERFGVSVHAGGCFIQKKYRRIAQDGARNAQPLAFAGAEKDAPLADLRVVTGGKPVDEVMAIGGLGGVNKIARRGVEPAKAIFSRTVPLNRNTSWLTYDICRRSHCSDSAAMSRPSMLMTPACGRYSPSSRLTIVDLPAPVGPTMANVLRDGTMNDIALRTGRSSKYANETFSNFTSPMAGSCVPAATCGLPCSTAASKISKTRSLAARADCKS